MPFCTDLLYPSCPIIDAAEFLLHLLHCFIRFKVVETSNECAASMHLEALNKWSLL